MLAADKRELFLPMNYPNLLYTTLLSASLLVPFALGLALTEPYPAVLMPSWAGTIGHTCERIRMVEGLFLVLLGPDLFASYSLFFFFLTLFLIPKRLKGSS